MPKISFVRSFTSFNENSTANTQLAYDFLLHRRKLMMSIYHELRALYNFHSTSRVFPLQTIAGFKPTIRLGRANQRVNPARIQNFNRKIKAKKLRSTNSNYLVDYKLANKSVNPTKIQCLAHRIQQWIQKLRFRSFMIVLTNYLEPVWQVCFVNFFLSFFKNPWKF